MRKLQLLTTSRPKQRLTSRSASLTTPGVRCWAEAARFASASRGGCWGPQDGLEVVQAVWHAWFRHFVIPSQASDDTFVLLISSTNNCSRTFIFFRERVMQSCSKPRDPNQSLPKKNDMLSLKTVVLDCKMLEIVL